MLIFVHTGHYMKKQQFSHVLMIGTNKYSTPSYKSTGPFGLFQASLQIVGFFKVKTARRNVCVNVLLPVLVHVQNTAPVTLHVAYLYDRYSDHSIHKYILCLCVNCSYQLSDYNNGRMVSISFFKCLITTWLRFINYMILIIFTRFNLTNENNKFYTLIK